MLLGRRLLLTLLVCLLGSFCVFAEPPNVDFGRIGVPVVRSGTSNFLTAGSVIPKTPADLAGIRKGDSLVEINGTTTAGMSVSEARKAFIGPVGAAVELTVLHNGGAKSKVSIKRKELPDVYMAAAIAGDATAEFGMGYYLARGPAATRDPTKAASWFLKAARQSYPAAEAALGYLYSVGRGVPKDAAAAADWELKAAKQDDVAAENEIARFYEYGYGVPQDYKQAFDWYYAAALHDDPKGETGVAFLYLVGTGISRDAVKSFNWYYRAAMQGNAEGEDGVGYAYQFGYGVKADCTAAAFWDLKAAKQGVASSERDLGLLYQNGTGVPQNDKIAFAWLYAAAVADDAYAEANLAYMYHQGRGVPKDNEKSFSWYYRAARHGNADGAYGVGSAYLYGVGVKQNYEESLKWYFQARPAFPNDKALAQAIAYLTFERFLKDQSVRSVDLSLIRPALPGYMRPLFWGLAAIYVAGGLLLIFFSMKPCGTPPGFALAFGWIVFYAESQAAAMSAIFLFCKQLTMEGMLLALVLCGAVPALASSVGPNLARIWKPSTRSFRVLLVYGAAGILTFFAIDAAYAATYLLIAHKALPPQNTVMLIRKAKELSSLVAYACVGVIGPAAEELIFRYYLFGALRRRFSGTVAVVGTAFVFALAHVQWLAFIPLFGFGLVVGWIRLKTDSLRLAVLLHALTNTLAVLSLG